LSPFPFFLPSCQFFITSDALWITSSNDRCIEPYPCAVEQYTIFGDPTAVTLKITVLWYGATCTLADITEVRRAILPLPSSLKRAVVYFFETSVTEYKNTQCHIQEDRKFQNNCVSKYNSSPNTIRMIRLNKKRWARHVVPKGEIRNA
jgi:hypothetical protein